MGQNPNTGLATRKTAAQRQAARRQKLRVQENQRRLNVWIDVSACNALRRMARRDAVTQSQCLGREAHGALARQALEDGRQRLEEGRRSPLPHPAHVPATQLPSSRRSADHTYAARA